MKNKPLILLDIGGNYFGAQSEPVTTGLDGNKFLVSILEQFKTYIKDRITIEELISRISTRLYNGGWFIPLGYKLVYPSNEQEILIGSYKKRYSQANELNTAFGIQLRVSLDCDCSLITLYSNNTIVPKELVMELTYNLANITNTMLDPENNGKYLDEIDIAEYSVDDSDIENRDLARGIQHAEFPVIGVNFNLSPESKLYKYLDSTEGMAKLVHVLSVFFDFVVERLDNGETN